MYSLSGTGLMLAQGLGFAAAGALGEIVAPSSAIAIAGLTGLTAVAALGSKSNRSADVAATASVRVSA
jgi:hypothetical protein